jgi:hypothetical protein
MPLKQESDSSKKMSKEDTVNLLMENSVTLQKVVTNLSINLDNLSKQIENLLKLFEMSAKSVAEKTISTEMDTKKIIQKIDNLTEQNKVIAKSLSLMHEKDMFSPSLPPLTQSPPEEEFQGGIDVRGYQRSISTK